MVASKKIVSEESHVGPVIVARIEHSDRSRRDVSRGKAHVPFVCADADTALAHAVTSVHCEPTWNVKPAGVSPSSRAVRSTPTAAATGTPNFDDNGKRLCVSSRDTRTMTPEPGASRAIFVISARLSAAKSDTPAAY